MQEIGVKYTVDVEGFLRDMQKVDDRYGDVEDRLQKLRKVDPFAQAATASSQVNKALGQQIQNYQLVTARVNSLTKEHQKLEAELKRIQQEQGKLAAGKEYDQLKQRLAQVEAQLEKLQKAMVATRKESEGASSTFGRIGESIKTAFSITGILLFIQKIAETAKELINVTGESEKYQNQFTRIFEGNGEAAKGYLTTLQKTADTTNFTFQELTDNAAKLASRGIIPTEKELLKLGDTANFINKPFEQLNEAILDANNPERWKELGFVVTTTGNQMTLSYGSFSKTVDKTVKGAYDAIQAFASQAKVMGSTAEAGKTLSGRISTLQDSFSGLLRTIGQDGKGAINDVLDKIIELTQAGITLYKSLSPSLGGLGQSFLTLGKSILSIGGALIGFNDQANTTATGVQRFGYYFEKYLIKPLTGITLVVSAATEGISQVFLYLEYASARVRGDKSLTAALDQQLEDSKKRIAAIQQQLREGDKKITLQDYVNQDNQAKRRAERRARLSQESYENFKPTDTGKPTTATAPDTKKVKAQQDEYNLLLDARKKYQDELTKLETEFGKEQLEALDKNSVEYIKRKAQADRDAINAEQKIMEAYYRTSQATQTRINQQTGKREAVVDPTLKLPAKTQSIYDNRRAAVDTGETQKLAELTYQQRLSELQMGKQFDQLELAELTHKWEEYKRITLAGFKGTADERTKLQTKLDAQQKADESKVKISQALRDITAQEETSLAFVNQKAFADELKATKANALGIVNVESEKQKKILEIQIEAGEKKIAYLKEMGEKENAAVIASTQATVDALKQQQKDFTSLDFSSGAGFFGSLLGLGGAELQQFKDGLSAIGNAVQESTQAIIDASQQRIQALDSEIQAKQSQIETEEERSKAGYANNLALATQQLNDLQAQKAREQQIQRDALKKQQELNLISATSDNIATTAKLTLAAANAIESATTIPFLGIFLAIAAAATLYSTIAGFKAKVSTLNKMREGGRIPLSGKSHEQGGHWIEGTDIEVERGEHVINARSSEKYDQTLEALNKNNPHYAFQMLMKEANFGLPQSVIEHIKGPEFSRPAQSVQLANNERELREIKAILREHLGETKKVAKNTKPGKKLTSVAPGIVAIQDGENISYNDMRDELKKKGIKLDK